MSGVTVMRREGEEVHRRVVNHPGRGDSRRPMTELELEAETLSPEELRTKANQQMAVDQWKEEEPSIAAEFEVFLKRHPEYIDRGEAGTRNAKKMKAHLNSPEKISERRRNGHRYVRCEHLEGGLADLSDELELNQQVLHDKRCAAVEARVSEAPADREEAYKVPIERLKELVSSGRSHFDSE